MMQPYPGYHIINSDNPSAADDASQTNWVFGGAIAMPVQWKDYTLEISLGYAEGNSTFYTYRSTAEHLNPPTYDVELRYRRVPVELFWVKPLNKNLRLLSGINVVAQHRILSFPDKDMPNDRLLSFGMGLSAQLRANLFHFSSGNASLFGNIGLRWTEYFIHDKNGRNVDGFEMRHVTISPQIGVSWDL